MTLSQAIAQTVDEAIWTHSVNPQTIESEIQEPAHSRGPTERLEQG